MLDLVQSFHNVTLLVCQSLEYWLQMMNCHTVFVRVLVQVGTHSSCRAEAQRDQPFFCTFCREQIDSDVRVGAHEDRMRDAKVFLEKRERFDDRLGLTRTGRLYGFRSVRPDGIKSSR